MQPFPGSRVRRAGIITRAGVLATALLIAGCATPRSQAPRARASPDTLRLVAYNVHHGAGMDEAIDLARIARLLGGLEPDLVALQEVDRGVRRTGGLDQAAQLGALTGMEPVFGEFMPYQGGSYGMAVLSGLPVLSSVNHRLPDGEEPRSAVALRVRLPSGRGLVFVGIHLYRTADERLAQAVRLVELMARDTLPVVLAGDFNSEPGSAVLDTLRAHWAVVEKGGDRLTFPSYEPDREIDFMMLRPAGRFRVIEHRVVDEPVISDHLPLLLVVEVY